MRKVLALNSLWLPVDIIDYKDCFKLLAKEHAYALEPIECPNGGKRQYVVHTLGEWIEMHNIDWSTYSQDDVEELDDGTLKKDAYVNTVHLEIPLPELILLTKYAKMPERDISFNKENLLIRDGHKCAYCTIPVDRDTCTVDHVIPQAKGGETSWTNCVIACKACNQEKADTMPSGRFLLKNPPKEPHATSPIYHVQRKGDMENAPESWKDFLFK